MPPVPREAGRCAWQIIPVDGDTLTVVLAMLVAERRLAFDNVDHGAAEACRGAVSVTSASARGPA